jgi:hypothetical protein
VCRYLSEAAPSEFGALGRNLVLLSTQGASFMLILVTISFLFSVSRDFLGRVSWDILTNLPPGPGFKHPTAAISHAVVHGPALTVHDTRSVSRSITFMMK